MAKTTPPPTRAASTALDVKANDLKATTTSSCIAKPPLIDYDPDGKPPVLNYNLPQSSCVKINGHIVFLIKKDAPCVRPELFSVPENNIFDQVQGMTNEQIVSAVNSNLVGIETTRVIQNAKLVTTKNIYTPTLQAKMQEGQPGTVWVPPSTGVNPIPSTSPTATSSTTPSVGSINVNTMVNQISAGNLPIATVNLYGNPDIKYISQPKKPTPMISIVLHYKVCSFLGDYGAGRTLKTFSLLPGEKTTISIRTYKQIEEKMSSSQNIIDSWGEEATNAFENSLQNTSVNDNMINSLAISASYEASASILKLGSADMSASINTSMTGSVGTHNEQITNALENHLSQSQHNRDIEINTETSTSVTTQNEESIVRNLENINHSRVLNFVFRQLLQEYITLTYIDNVSLVFTNGYPEKTFSAPISQIDDFLDKIYDKGAPGSVCEATVLEIKNNILAKLCSIHDYQDTPQALIECVQENVNSCCEMIQPPIGYALTYIRKKKDLHQTYNGITVPGIITSAKHYVLRTDSVITEALLGQGEALDCYNQKLQEAATVDATLKNQATQQQISIINAITDPLKKAEMYKKVFGECCDTPQSCCCNPSPTAP